VSPRVPLRLPAALACLIVLSSACAPKRFAPPSGPGAPYPDYAAAFDAATAACRQTKSITATIALSGRAGKQKLRGQVDAGLTGNGAARLEGRAPFGRPVFILVSGGGGSGGGPRATLYLPRDNRVLRDAPAADIIEALTGVSLTFGELMSALAGCGLGGRAASGLAYGADQLAIAADAGTTSYLRRQKGQWNILASTRGPLTIENADLASGRPSTIRMRTSPGAAGTDLTLKLSDVDINTTIDPKAFVVDVPRDAEPLTLDELRRAGPLGGGN
jgi:outer membrane lipoprotein-sorting protein